MLLMTSSFWLEKYEEAVKISEALFKGDIKSFTGKDIEIAFKGLTPIIVKEPQICLYLV